MGVHFRFSVQNSGFSSYMFLCLCLSSCFCVQHAEHSPENDVGQPSGNASQTAPVDEETQEGPVDAQHITSQHTTAQHNIQCSTAYYSTTQHNTAPTAAQESLPPSLPPSLPSLPPSLPTRHFPSCVVTLGRVCLFFFFRFSFIVECFPACQLTKVRTPPQKNGRYVSTFLS